MKRYYWQLVLIGATLLMTGLALPWFRWSGGGPWRLGQPISGYVLGFLSLCGLPVAVGGLILLGMALNRDGEPESRSYPLIASLVCALLIVGTAWRQVGPGLADLPSYSPALGLWVSLLGVGLCMVGSLIPASRAAVKKKTGIAVLVALELCIVFAGLILLTHPGVGVQLGIWESAERLPSCVRAIGSPTAYGEEQYSRCLTQQAASTPTPWSQFWGH